MLGRLSPCAALALLAVLDATVARPPGDGDAASDRPRRGLLPVAAALVPGLVVHGSGHFVAGDREAARRLLAAEAVGLGLVVAGIAGLSLTGASRKTIAPFIVLSAGGVALLGGSGLADLYGVVAPAGGWGQALAEPPVEAALATLYVRNPTLPYRWVTGARVKAWAGDWFFAPAAFATTDRQTLRFELRLGHRVWGAAPGDGRPADRYIDVSAGLLHHRELRGSGPFDHSTGDVSVAGRYGLGSLLPSLAGSFAEWGVGAAMGAYRYGGPAPSTEARDALLMRLGFGCWFGSSEAPRGELLLFYDHRHDGFAGGMKVVGLGSGAGGHVGAEASVHLLASWGLGFEFAAGSAHVFGLSLRYQAERDAR